MKSRWYHRFRPLRFRLECIEDYLWGGDAPRMSLLRTVDERLEDLTHKVDALAKALGREFVYNHEREAMFKLVSQEDARKLMGDERW